MAKRKAANTVVSTVKLAVVTYEVWGNARDGWEVNNMYRSGAPHIEVQIGKGEELEDAIFRTLKQTEAPDGNRWLKASVRRKAVNIEWMGGDRSDFLVEDVRTPRLCKRRDVPKNNYGWGRPVYMLEEVREEVVDE